MSKNTGLSEDRFFNVEDPKQMLQDPSMETHYNFSNLLGLLSPQVKLCKGLDFQEPPQLQVPKSNENMKKSLLLRLVWSNLNRT